MSLLQALTTQAVLRPVDAALANTVGAPTQRAKRRAEA